MKTTIIQGIAIVILTFFACVNWYVDYLDRKNLIDFQTNALLYHSDISSINLTYPNIVEAVGDNRTVNQDLFKRILKLEKRQDQLWEHENYQIEESNKKFLRKRDAKRKAKHTQSFSIGFGSMMSLAPCQWSYWSTHPTGSDDPGCWPIGKGYHAWEHTEEGKKLLERNYD